jgi:hypothetical protein
MRVAQAPTKSNSSPPAINVDNVSRKSLFNDWFPLERPGVERERPHHFQAIRGRGRRRDMILSHD